MCLIIHPACTSLCNMWHSCGYISKRWEARGGRVGFEGLDSIYQLGSECIRQDDNMYFDCMPYTSRRVTYIAEGSIALCLIWLQVTVTCDHWVADGKAINLAPVVHDSQMSHQSSDITHSHDINVETLLIVVQFAVNLKVWEDQICCVYHCKHMFDRERRLWLIVNFSIMTWRQKLRTLPMLGHTVLVQPPCIPHDQAVASAESL